MDQVQAACLPEFLALGMSMNPASFDPSQTTPGDLAQQKARTYLFPYLMNRYLAGLRLINTPAALLSEFEVDAGDLAIAQLQRLQYNYNAHFKVANYLADLKARTGLLASLTARHAMASVTKSAEVIGLAGQIGQSLAVAAHIIDECDQLTTPTYFTERIVTGTYPLALLFTRERETTWLDHFFARAAQLTIDNGRGPALEMAGELLSQTQLDVQVLPACPAKDGLSQFITQVTNDIKSEY